MRTLVGPAPTVAPAAWASVRLIEGQAEANTWHVDSSTARAQLAIGSAETCAWRITAAGVAHVHFELWWDGRRLWISDTRRAGGVVVDGAPVGDWQELPGRARIEFGRAVMLAESSVPAVRVADAIDEEASGEIPAHAARTLVSDPSEILRRRRPDAPPSMREPDDSGDGEGEEEPSPGNATLIRAPRPLGLAMPPRAPFREEAFRPDALGPQRIGGGAAGPDRFAADPARNGGSPPPRTQPSRALSPSPGSSPTVIMPAYGRPALLGPAVGKGRATLSVPARTWLFAAATAAALVFVLLQGGGGDEDAADEDATQESAAPVASGSSTGADPAAADAPDVPGAATLAALADRAAAIGAGGPAAGADRAAAAGAATGTGTATGDGAAPAAKDAPPAAAPHPAGGGATEAQAADLLAAGRQREALALYDELARSRPEQPAFAAIVVILQRRLTARCAHAEPGGAPCPAVHP
ncbi:MAG TPA: FHA domain-containing protein [Kofleriaceae bacterium]|nr:FHA domain-containing protein [Kofleriaceae bacterium]